MEKSNINKSMHFSQEQIKWLEDNFPVRVLTSSADEATMRFYFGQQAVIHFIKTYSSGGKHRVQHDLFD